MRMSKKEFSYWLEGELCNSIDEGVKITIGMVEHAYGVVADNFRETDPNFELTFEVNDRYFQWMANKLN